MSTTTPFPALPAVALPTTTPATDAYLVGLSEHARGTAVALVGIVDVNREEAGEFVAFVTEQVTEVVVRDLLARGCDQETIEATMRGWARELVAEYQLLKRRRMH